jgi:glycosyltransferase involved in cell wall biosynthesis
MKKCKLVNEGCLKMKLKKKYKILLVIRWPIGGIRTFIRYVYRNFDFRRYSFTIIAPDLPELRILLSDLDDLDLFYISLGENPSIISFFRAVSKTIINGKFDLIHSHGFTAGICSILGSVLTQTPHILTSHDVLRADQFKGFKGYIKKKALLFALPIIDIIHSVSQDAQQNLIEYVPSLRIFNKKLVAIPNGIEVERFLNSNKQDLRKKLGLSDDTFFIGFLGRFMPQKGFVYLIDAMEILYNNCELLRKPLILAFGEGAFIREDKQYVREKGLEAFVYFMPFTSDVSATISGLEVVVIPSLWEACPLLPMEAMALGVPVIGTDCIGLREVLKDTVATVVPIKDSHALADALMREMRNSSRPGAILFKEEAVRRFDVKRQSKELEKVILRLLD